MSRTQPATFHANTHTHDIATAFIENQQRIWDVDGFEYVTGGTVEDLDDLCASGVLRREVHARLADSNDEEVATTIVTMPKTPEQYMEWAETCYWPSEWRQVEDMDPEEFVSERINSWILYRLTETAEALIGIGLSRTFSMSIQFKVDGLDRLAGKMDAVAAALRGVE